MPKITRTPGTAAKRIVTPGARAVPRTSLLKAYVIEKAATYRADKKRSNLQACANAALKEMERRKAQAKQAREIGATFDYPLGGAHGWVTAENRLLRQNLYLESNHSPPEASYRGSPWENWPSGQRPAHAMLYYHHRSPRGSVGGASSTGGSGVQSGWTGDLLNGYMRAGEFYKAMRADFIDVLNTTAPNRGYYALSLYKAAQYAHRVGLLKTDEEFADVVSVLENVMCGEPLAEACEMADMDWE